MILDPIKDIWNRKEITILDSVVIEKISEESAEYYRSTEEVKAAEENRSHGGGAEWVVDTVGSFLKTHTVRVDLWNSAKLRIQRSQENPKNLEIIFFTNRGTSNDNGEGKCRENIY
jgi:hypothetical protein